MAARRRLRILLLCDDRKDHANTVLDHINSFTRYSRHDVRKFNPRGVRTNAALELDEFDAVVIHYSVALPYEWFVSRDMRDKLRRFQGLKVQFIQDEYRWVDRATAATRDAGVHVLFTCAPEPAAGQLYDARLPGVRRVETLTGYVPQGLEDRPVRRVTERRVDVAYRGRDLPYWLGRLTQEKAWIAQGFLERAPRYGLNVDIGWREQDRIYGDRWIEFISSARATLGTESGASIADFDGSVEAAVTGYLAEHPGAAYQEVHVAVLQPYEGNVVVNVISPRVFEAAALGTALVMFPGSYSGIVRPEEHYIVLAKDFSNMAEVAAKIKDEAMVSAMVERTHQDLVASHRWTYESFIETFDAVVEEELRGRARRVAPRYRLAQIERIVRVARLRSRFVEMVVGLAYRAAGRKPPPGPVPIRAALGRGRLMFDVAMREPAVRRIYRLGSRNLLSRRGLAAEMLKLGILLRAAEGRLDSLDAFSVTCRFEPGEGVMRFVSVPGAAVAARKDNGSGEKVAAGSIKRIEWDHTAIGPTVRLRRPRVDLGVGIDGFVAFVITEQIARSDPHALDGLAGFATRPVPTEARHVG